MQTPLQLSFEHVEHSDKIESRIRDETEKLERFYDRITSVRVIVSQPQHRRHHGDIYQVRVFVTVPDAPEIAVDRAPGERGAHEDVFVTIRDAFKAARRQLQDFARKRQGKIKAHDVPPHGQITSLHPDSDHGFIAAADGREIYFHRNSVANSAFEQLSVGQEVRFSESVGDKGPQASFVQPVGKHHLG